MKYLTEQQLEPSNNSRSQSPEDVQDYISNLEADLIDATNAIEYAYGYLWRSMSCSREVIEARKLLLNLMDKENQKRGIEAALVMFGEMTDHEILMHGI